jgi:hypothetical protein
MGNLVHLVHLVRLALLGGKAFQGHDRARGQFHADPF